MENLLRIFTVPEAPGSTLSRLENHISANLAGFLQDHIVAEETDLVKIERDFNDTEIPEQPVYVSDQAQFLLEKVVAQSVHTSSPSFVGHMTSALPYFMIPLSKIMIALNQNLVKTETSKAFTPLERQVLGMLHRLVYGEPEAFYDRWLHDSHRHLGLSAPGAPSPISPRSGRPVTGPSVPMATSRALRAAGYLPRCVITAVKALRCWYRSVATIRCPSPPTCSGSGAIRSSPSRRMVTTGSVRMPSRRS
ncbi:hypothetical protein [Marinobacterium aestuariivivens]|uniref:Uncharacterized protein n=1 Tax=Marinobacterium aestuariivivens TaxID=1698799 RepID=A0ABW2A6W1_9GAMM